MRAICLRSRCAESAGLGCSYRAGRRVNGAGGKMPVKVVRDSGKSNLAQLVDQHRLRPARDVRH